MKTIHKITNFTVATSFLLSLFVANVTPAFAADPVTVHARLYGKSRTIFNGDLSFSGCTIKDTDGTDHVFTTPVAICAVQKAAESGNFPIQVQNFAGFGLFVNGIAEDTGNATAFWLYDINGTPASQGASSLVVNTNDTVFFHFDDPTTDKKARAITDALAYLKTNQADNGSITGFGGVSQWATLAFLANSVDIGTVKKGSTSLASYLPTDVPATNAVATELERRILAITAQNQDPRSYGGVNYIDLLNAKVSGGQLGDAVLVNDDVFGLLALISAGDIVSTELKQAELDYILSKQNSDGGFSWSATGTSDGNDTAATIQALRQAKKIGLLNAGLDAAITNARAYLLTTQNADGGFGYDAVSDSDGSSTAWALMALNSLGEGTSTEAAKASDWLIADQAADGGLMYQVAFGGDTSTTAHGLIGIAGKEWVLNIFEGEEASPTPTPTIIVTPTSSPAASPSPTVTLTAAPTPAVTATPTNSPTPTDEPEVTSTPTPTLIPEEEVTPTETPAPEEETPTPSPTPTATPTPEPEANVFGFMINDGSELTGERTVRLQLKYPKGTKQVRFSEDELTGNRGWKNTRKEYVFGLSRGSGLKVVHVQFKKADGKIVTAPDEAIILDTKAPIGAIVINGDESNTVTREVELNLAAQDEGGRAVQMRISASPLFRGTSWEQFAETKNWTLEDLNRFQRRALRRVYVQFRDEAGNVSQREVDSIYLSK